MEHETGTWTNKTEIFLVHVRIVFLSLAILAFGFPEFAILAFGRLGSLTGGLLTLDDQRDLLTAEQP